ncbi:hypothetical protein K504DRAFT_159193 [Pleomassaria siparia CBS 279.74]|uniref:Uncharacterized protein n=1 Tax=Pleomassaria siparia CBS 279.74 TaxID=1314801 RepID=A0A6G1JU81_9PLEO|nr:hypothetical protein K504DRAFT_159193 [Pleomassaria siparia CBS 279.74]
MYYTTPVQRAPSGMWRVAKNVPGALSPGCICRTDILTFIDEIYIFIQPCTLFLFKASFIMLIIYNTYKYKSQKPDQSYERQIMLLTIKFASHHQTAMAS